MLDESSRGPSRRLRPRFVAVAAVALAIVGQTYDVPTRSVSADAPRSASPTAAAGPLELPELAYRPEPLARASALPAILAPSQPSVPSTPLPTASVVAPARTPAPAPARTAAPSAPSPVTAPAAAACAADWICYARVGLSGPIVPYTDCSGGSDVGTAIRAFVCLSPTYLLGHAYTPFGKITQWRAGDVVYAYGRPYTVTGATTQSSCAPPVLPLAPLSLQTSLSPNACGLVLVVQAR